jgi:hypothetical protein
LDRLRGEADDFDAITAVAAEFRERVGGLPVGEAWYSEQVDGLGGQVPSWSSLTDGA